MLRRGLERCARGNCIRLIMYNSLKDVLTLSSFLEYYILRYCSSFYINIQDEDNIIEDLD